MEEHHHEITEDQIFFLAGQKVTLEEFDAPGPILDIGGGGEGIIGQLKGERVIAIDPSRRELEEAPPGPLKIVMDARDLQFLDGMFPTITAFFTLMYVKGAEHEQVFREVYRVLAPDGQFLIWDTHLPRCLDEEKKIVAFRLRVHLPDREISTGYGARWPGEEQDLAYYVRLAKGVGFQVLEQCERDRVLFLKLSKPDGL